MTLPRILTLVPNLPHVHLGIAKAIQTLAASEEEQKQRLTRAAVDDPKHPGWPLALRTTGAGNFAQRIPLSPLTVKVRLRPTSGWRWSRGLIPRQGNHFPEKRRSRDWAEAKVAAAAVVLVFPDLRPNRACLLRVSWRLIARLVHNLSSSPSRL